MIVGFAGLGRMGTEMARNLARAGHDPVLWNRSAAKAVDLAGELDCRTAATPRALADTCDIVITMLADDAASQTVHEGTDGLFAGTRAKTFLEMGTMSPDHVAALGKAAPKGSLVIDAPVSGATQAAREASLLIMAGCSQAQAAPFMPLFDAVGRQTICLGRAGAGAVMKLAVNSLIHGINQTLAEAMTLAEAAGIETATAFDVIEASAACAPMLKYRRPLYLDEDAHAVTFTVALARKDMAVAAALAATLGVAMPQGAVTLARLREAEARGYAHRDMASILQFMREENQ
ncbi:MAG: NAD(P)-dependent oxidoreductase [Zhengella sp.]|uniref:NAD(P)-dependent oxidoreductase n=1 Tax=Zhengella sp. TaxID=2282762 RepID=UPI001DD9213C|nr:NAD(P)-dependent oxidoreductase [Notoacmeibacter sp.]MCC0026107.1 NAD(P)-dependent oxidoreductase [Brucellaceae bacterium]